MKIIINSSKELTDLLKQEEFKTRFEKGELTENEMVAILNYGSNSLFFKLFNPFHEKARQMGYAGHWEQPFCLVSESFALEVASPRRKNWQKIKQIYWPYLVTEKVIELLVKRAGTESRKLDEWPGFPGSSGHAGTTSYDPSLMRLITEVCPERKDLRDTVISFLAEKKEFRIFDFKSSVEEAGKIILSIKDDPYELKSFLSSGKNHTAIFEFLEDQPDFPMEEFWDKKLEDRAELIVSYFRDR